MVGATDRSHMTSKTIPVNKQIEYFNPKQDYSIVVPAVDVSFKFLDVGTDFPDSIHHVHILRLSELHRKVAHSI